MKLKDVFLLLLLLLFKVGRTRSVTCLFIYLFTFLFKRQIKESQNYAKPSLLPDRPVEECLRANTSSLLFL